MSGGNPKEFMSFKDFNFSKELELQIEAQGFTNPTPIQKEAIPVVLSGRDVMGLAQTGTGKTAAFVLPLLQKVITGARGKVQAIVIAPTRELAEQINADIRVLGKKTNIRSVTIYGGVSNFKQVMALKRGVDIIVACPGRLLDHMGQKSVDLSGVKFLVLDEADQMMDMGFLPTIKKIIKNMPAGRQTLMFSATMPEQIKGLADEILSNPVQVRVAYTEPLNNIEHLLFRVDQANKSIMLLEVLKTIAAGSIIIFTRTKDRSEKLGKILQRHGHDAVSFQGNLSQARRRAILDGFRNNDFQILVATDIAARGIDVSLVSHVINYDLPDTLEAYTHRIGRTGRASRSGDAFSFVTKGDFGYIRALERKLDKKLAYSKLEITAANLAEYKQSELVDAGKEKVDFERSGSDRSRFSKRPMVGGHAHSKDRFRKFKRNDKSGSGESFSRGPRRPGSWQRKEAK